MNIACKHDIDVGIHVCVLCAAALIDGLSGEKIRWTEASKTFESQINRLVGDVLLACGFLSYSGPFNQDFRTLIMKGWKKELVTNKIPFSDVRLWSSDFTYITTFVYARTKYSVARRFLSTDTL